MRVLQMIARRLAATFVLSKKTDLQIDAQAQDASAPDREAPTFEAVDPDDAEYRVVARHIADLMLVDEWIEIGETIAEWEAELEATPGGLRFHEIAVDVALSGLQSLIDAAPHDTLADLDDAKYELSCFVETHKSTPDDHVLGLLAAKAHLIMGDTCRADHWPDEIRTDAWRRMAHHYVEAAEILKLYDARALMSPLVAEVHYLAAKGAPNGSAQVPDRFMDWIDLDPSNPRTYAIHADWLADPDNASQETLLRMADDAVERTEQTLGMGGYALFFQPLLSLSEDIRDFYDPETYATGILDLATLSATQADVNRAANALADEVEQYGTEVPAALKDTLLILVKNEIEVFYPSLWTRPEDDIRTLINDAAAAIPDISLEKAA